MKIIESWSPLTTFTTKRKLNKLRIEGMIAICEDLSVDEVVYLSEQKVLKNCKQQLEKIIKKWSEGIPNI